MPNAAGAVRIEIRRLLRPPWDELRIMVLNAAIVGFGWWLLPGGPIKQWLFPPVPGPWAVVITLLAWLVGDVTSTNLMANDSSVALAALTEPRGITRLLRAKILALATLVGPTCAVVAWSIGVRTDRLSDAVILTPVWLLVPLGPAAVACWVGIILPYRPHSLHWRWTHLRPWPRTLRWAVAVLVPYTVANTIMNAITRPSLRLARAFFDQPGVTPAPTAFEVVTATSVAVLSLTVFGVATALAARIAVLRRPQLTAFLGNPDAA